MEVLEVLINNNFVINLEYFFAGKHKFSVIFGVGGNKFRTDVVENLFDNPVFNAESEMCLCFLF